MIDSQPRYSSLADLLARIDEIDPRQYDKTRNYLDGAVTWLSPYLTHGVINTHTVASRVLEQHREKSCYRLLFELAWREYFHRVWQENDDAIFDDMYSAQLGVQSDQLPQAIADANTRIDVLDSGIKQLKKTGFMHNHMRMWLAGTTCSVAHTHWKEPARWLYYHLLDGDLASNTLSWQWIAGTFSHKQYIANQDNINKYSRTNQQGSWLDVDYETLAVMQTPPELKERTKSLHYPQQVPGTAVPSQMPGKVGLRSLWNLNPDWLSGYASIPQVLFIEKRQIEQWPMSENRWAFISHWINLLGVDMWCGSVEELHALVVNGTEFVREEYPACAHWPGTVMERTFHFDVPDKEYRSFSSFWKQVK